MTDTAPKAATTAQRQRDALARTITLSVVVLVSAVLLVITVYVMVIAPASEGFSTNPEVWGQFGDYFGGILNPLIAFGAFYWLTRSVALQKQELEDTRKELQESKDAQIELALAQREMVTLSALTALLRNVEAEQGATVNAIAMVEHHIKTNASPLRYRGEQYSHSNGKYELLETLFSREAALEAEARKYRNRIVSEQLINELVSEKGTPQADTDD